MDLMPTSDQEAIAASVRSFLEHELPMERVRRLGEAGAEEFDALWRAAGELGFFGLGLPAEVGGAGYALTEEMVLLEELGRTLAPGPWLGGLIAAHALRDVRAAELVELRRRILAGELRVALIDGLDRPLPAAVGAVRVTGTQEFVADAAVAGAYLVLDGGAAVLVPGGSGGVRVEPRASMDPTRAVARVAFSDAAGIAIEGGAARAAALRREATALACAEAVGSCQRTVELSVEYAKTRTQFDRPIGSFQAVKHRCADMAVRAEAARSATIYAIVSLRDGAPDADFQVAVAKVLCTNAFVQNAADNVQNHGGMGFTWECDAHLYVKRARSFDVAFGTRTQQLDRLVAGLRAG